MSNSPADGPQDGVLAIPLRDRSAFEAACLRATTSDAVRVAVIHVPGAPQDGGSIVEPGMPATLADVQAPVVAALSGQVDDRRLELALAADIRICDAETTFSLAAAGQDGFPSDGGTQRLPRIVGPALAADMLLTGRRISAAEAALAGLVTEVVGRGDAPDRAHRVAAAISSRGRSAARFTKEAVLNGADMPLDQAVRLEADLAILLHADAERDEGINAFKSRRPPGYLSGAS